MKAVILAAGRGTRLEPVTSDLPKCMLPLAGKPVLEHMVEAIREIGIDEISMVIGYKGEAIRGYFEDGKSHRVSIKYIEQEKRLGTAHALGLKKFSTDFLAINGDTMISSGDIKRVVDEHNADATLGVKRLEDALHYGVVKMKDSKVVEIVEKPKKSAPGYINAGIYVFSPKIFDAIAKTKSSKRGEYEITSSIQMMIDEGLNVRALELKDPWSDIGNPWNYLDSNQLMMEKMEEKIEGEVEEFVKVKGTLHLGKGSVIRSGTYIEGPAYIGENTIIGPNAYLRGFASIGSNCRVGNAVEIKNSIIMDHTYIPHLSYVGDSIIGRNCNFGAGTLVGNLRLDERSVKMRIRGALEDTGRRKMGCIVGDNVKTGLNVMINAGRKIGQNSMIGPGVIVYHDVPPNSFILEKQEVRKR